jgi:hypothetical protein
MTIPAILAKNQKRIPQGIASQLSFHLTGKLLATYKRIGITFLFANKNHYAILILSV